MDSSVNRDTAFITGALELGGGTTFLLNLGRELIRHQQGVTIFCVQEQNPLMREFVDSGIDVLVAPEKGAILEDRLAFVLNHLRTLRPEVVVANLGMEGFEILRYVPRGTRRVGMAHADSPGVYDLLSRYAGDLDVIGAVSAKITEKLRESAPATPPAVVHFPLGIPMGEDHTRRARPAEMPLRILYLGRVAVEQKRVQFFPEIVGDLVRKQIPFHLTIAGDGPERSWLESRFREDGLSSQVTFLGEVPYDQVRSILDDHDVFLLVSDYEGLPLSLLEAMGAGLVPVVSDLPSGVREVVNRDNGILVPLEPSRGYSEAIAGLHHDREKLFVMSASAREAVRRNFSTLAMYDRWESMLAQAPGLPAGWPESTTLLPIRGARHPLQFHPVLRPLRRLIKRSRRKV